MTRTPTSEVPRTDMALGLEAVSKVYRQGPAEVVALAPTNLTVPAGQFVAVMGPSGSGKTTMLQLLGGLTDPTSGTVRLGGRDVAAMGVREQSVMRRRHLGYVFQELNLLPGLTVLENVTLPLELDGLTFTTARGAALVALEQVTLEDVADRFPAELSGGQQQRVAIARAIVGPRWLLLADEPTGALDTVTGETIMRLLRDHADRGGTTVMVTHEARLASWADRVLFLRDGRVVDDTTDRGPSTLLERGRP